MRCLFYLRRIKLARKISQLERFHVTDCLRIFRLSFTLLMMIWISGSISILAKYKKLYQKTSTNCSWNLHNSNFWRKASMQKSAWRKLYNLKLSSYFFCFYFHSKLGKVMKSVKTLRFRGDWGKLWAKFWFY